MRNLKYLVTFLLLSLAFACSQGGPGPSAKALPDTPENRTVLAKKYLEAAPPAEMLHGLADMAEKSMPEKDRQIFKDAISSKALEDKIYKVQLDYLVQHFTTGELQAVLAYYGSPEGKAADKKFGPYRMAVITVLRQDLQKAMTEARKQQEPQPPTPPAPPAAPAPKK